MTNATVSAAYGVATVGGTREYRAQIVIDATADAYVAVSAGVATQQGDERGRVQPASLMFRLSHVDLAQDRGLRARESERNAHEPRARGARSFRAHRRRRSSTSYGIARVSAATSAHRAKLVSFFISPYPR